MGKIQALEKGFSVLRTNLPKGKINTSGLRYVPPKQLAEPVDKFVSSVPKEIAKPEVSKMDIVFFRRYLLGKKLDLKIEPIELEQLFSLEGKEFEEGAFEFLLKKLNIPSNIRPRLIESTQTNGCPMTYNFMLNQIVVNPNMKTPVKEVHLSLLRHELQHFMQNMQILRSEGVGTDAVKHYSEVMSKIARQNNDALAKNCTIEQLAQMGFDEEALNLHRQLKELLKNGTPEQYEEYMNQLEIELQQYYEPLYEGLRNDVVSSMGAIKTGSAEWKRAVKFLDETKKGDYYFQPDGQIDYAKYMTDCRENEAIVSQEILGLKLFPKEGGSCYIKELKQGAGIESSGDAKFDADMEKLAEERKNGNIDFKKMISYLYD